MLWMGRRDERCAISTKSAFNVTLYLSTQEEWTRENVVKRMFHFFSLVPLTFCVVQVPADLRIGLMQQINLFEQRAEDPAILLFPHRWTSSTSAWPTSLAVRIMMMMILRQRSRHSRPRRWARAAGRLVTLAGHSWWTVALGPIHATAASNCCGCSLATEAHILVVGAAGIAAKSGMEASECGPPN